MLTWNISDFDVSARAPPSWSRAQKIQKIVETITTLNPDVIALQEVDNYEIGDLLQNSGYSALKERPSHSGNVLLLFRKELGEFLVEVFTLGPTIGCTMLYPEIGIVGFFACHLPPNVKNNHIREAILTKMVQFLEPKTQKVIILGDMNMRMAENEVITRLQLEDAFLLAQSPEKYRFSWNGFKNPYHSDNHPFTCRFDRIFLRGFTVKQFEFVGHLPLAPSTDHFISDHFGLLVEFD
ncbi:MAG: endonuclease/exonuclease/phosphatase family protein [Promethearchaeota archaeon]